MIVMKKGQSKHTFIISAFVVLALAVVLFSNNVLILGKVTQDDTVLARPIPMIIVYILVGFIILATILLVIISYALPKVKSNKTPRQSDSLKKIDDDSFYNKKSEVSKSENLTYEKKTPREKPKSKEYFTMLKLIGEAQVCLNNVDKEGAEKIYTEIEKVFVTLRKDEKKELFEKAKTIYDQIVNLHKASEEGQ
jgi:hypothetical protein